MSDAIQALNAAIKNKQNKFDAGIAISGGASISGGTSISGGASIDSLGGKVGKVNDDVKSRVMITQAQWNSTVYDSTDINTINTTGAFPVPDITISNLLRYNAGLSYTVWSFGHFAKTFASLYPDSQHILGGGIVRSAIADNNSNGYGGGYHSLTRGNVPQKTSDFVRNYANVPLKHVPGQYVNYSPAMLGVVAACGVAARTANNIPCALTGSNVHNGAELMYTNIFTPCGIENDFTLFNGELEITEAMRSNVAEILVGRASNVAPEIDILRDPTEPTLYLSPGKTVVDDSNHAANNFVWASQAPLDGYFLEDSNVYGPQAKLSAEVDPYNGGGHDGGFGTIAAYAKFLRMVLNKGVCKDNANARVLSEQAVEWLLKPTTTGGVNDAPLMTLFGQDDGPVSHRAIHGLFGLTQSKNTVWGGATFVSDYVTNYLNEGVHSWDGLYGTAFAFDMFSGEWIITGVAQNSATTGTSGNPLIPANYLGNSNVVAIKVDLDKLVTGATATTPGAFFYRGNLSDADLTSAEYYLAGKMRRDDTSLVASSAIFPGDLPATSKPDQMVLRFASMTKLMGKALAAISLFDLKLIATSDPISKYVPELKGKFRVLHNDVPRTMICTPTTDGKNTLSLPA